MARSLKALLIRRLLLTIPILFGVSVLAFIFVAFAPQSPAIARLQTTNPEAIAQLEESMGLNRPLHVQYVDWLTSVLTGDLGQSLVKDQQVSTLLYDRIVISGQLAIFAVVWMVILAGSLGFISAFNRNKIQDHIARVYAVLGISVPDFVVGILLLLIFAVHLEWLPAGGFVPLSEGVGTYLKHMILPSYTVGFLFTAIVMRMFRGDLLEMMNKEHVKAAKAMGVPRYKVVLQDITKPAVIPTLTTIGMSISILISGVVITEIVFAIPGLGRLLVNAVFDGDFTIIQGAVLIIALVFVTANLVVDVLYYYLDPRIRMRGD
ncbi:ABC transporter permease [Haloarchaeobius salinus]|uniref:ABC transporter permease n=1 Tax=Haloarchaeobius salinus TaxID=1198298 RepID=UPI00210DD462|nr:ABC transporter permease [Haloarchaeobius salinus]